MTTATLPFTTPRTIEITSSTLYRKGGHKSATTKPWELYRITASDGGGRITEELRCFQDLPLGPIEVTAEARIVDGQIESYTLKPTRPVAKVPKANGGPGYDATDAVHDLAAGRVTALETRIAELERKLNALVRGLCSDDPDLSARLES